MEKRYRAAEKLLTKNIRNTVLNGRPVIHWESDGTFSYDRQIRTEQGIESMKVHVNGYTGEETVVEKIAPQTVSRCASSRRQDGRLAEITDVRLFLQMALMCCSLVIIT